MWRTLCLFILAQLSTTFLFAQPIIYNDATSLVTGFWNQNGTLTETSSNSPYEGSNHYYFDYSFTGYWAGLGLNFANWGPTGNDFTGYTHLRLAYRGMNGDQRMTIMLRSDAGAGNTLTLGNSTGSYEVVDIPLFACAAGTNLNLSSVTELDISVASDVATGSGALYFDDIQLVNLSVGGTTSAATQQRAASMQRGVNLSNWLEAYWLIPSGNYPDTDRFDADDVAAFRQLGFDAIRLPVTFEHLAGGAPNYTLDTSNPAFGLLDNAIEWAANNNMKLIIDMHHGITTLTDANYQTELPRLVAIWEQVISLYGDLDPNRYLFEVYNEPHDISNDNFRIVAQTLVDVIRDAGHSHSVIVGASGYNSAGELLTFTPLDDPDIIYTFHFYEPYLFTHQQMSWTSTPYLPIRAFPIGTDEADVNSAINAVGEWVSFYNAPVIVGEFGVTSEAPATDRCNWIELVAERFTDNGLPWFYWGATDISNGFGFFANGIISEANMTPCFGTALGLPATVLAIEDLSDIAVECTSFGPQLEWQLTTDEIGDMYVEAMLDATGEWFTLEHLRMRPEQKRYTVNTQENHLAYRIRIVELDGEIHYTRIAENPCWNKSNWEIFPNPVRETLNIRNQIGEGQVTIQLYNGLGQHVYTQTGIDISGSMTSSTSMPELASGIYSLQIWQDGRRLWQERLVVE